MATLGYKLSSEEFGPRDLVRWARRAEAAGFGFALISDHFHPWIDRQGQSPFVWSVIGALAETTERLAIGTGVTCPIARVHPAIVAQAAATAAAQLEGRFFLGVGSGERLNEHVVGAHWPEVEVRQERLAEAIAIIRGLWTGEMYSHHGRHFTVENARLYTRPATPPPLVVAAAGPDAATLAGRLGDGLVGTSPKKATIDRFRAAGGTGKPCYGELTVCWAADEAQARRTAREWWPNAALGGALSQELALPQDFEAACEPIGEDLIAQSIVCGPDPRKHLRAIEEYVRAGYTHVCVHQVGPDQEGCLRFYEREILPALASLSAAA